MADSVKKSTSGSPPSSLMGPRTARRESERQASVATADSKAVTEPDQNYPDERDAKTGLGESGFNMPGDEVTRSTRHQKRMDESSS